MLARRLARFVITAASVAFVAFLGARWQVRLPPGAVARTLSHAGQQRTYLLHAGSAKSKTALVLFLHGVGGHGQGIEKRAQFDAAAEQAGAVVAYPDAIAAVWNDGWWNSSSDDVGFLTALADSLVDEFGIDRSRVYAAGFSNGAGMAHRLACQSDRFAAIAAVSGDLATDVVRACNHAKIVSVLALHGTDDPTVPYGVQLTRTIDHWLRHDECAEPAQTTSLSDLDPSDGTRVFVENHARCRPGAEVTLYRIEGGGHTWPGEDFQWFRFRRPGRISRDIDANATILEFFLKHPQR